MTSGDKEPIHERQAVGDKFFDAMQGPGYLTFVFVAAHGGFEIQAEQAAEKGLSAPSIIFAIMILALYWMWNRWKRQPWYNLLLLFVPVVAGFKLHAMFEDVAEGKQWLGWAALIAFMVVYLFLIKLVWSIGLID